MLMCSERSKMELREVSCAGVRRVLRMVEKSVGMAWMRERMVDILGG